MNYLLVVVLLKKLIAFAVLLSMVDTFHAACYAFCLRAHLEDYLLWECSMWGCRQVSRGPLGISFLAVVGIEPITHAPKARALPLNHITALYRAFVLVPGRYLNGISGP